MKNTFKQEDKEKLTELLNIISQKSEFKVSLPEILKIFKLLAHVQQKILPKIESHIFEIEKVVEDKLQQKSTDNGDDL